ncbi:LrgB family protein [Nocardioides sp.]|uniref:LrgB family protein n=1 Tax=Nocardioides sp. TaxID=35761 RepID=UPI0035198B13
MSRLEEVGELLRTSPLALIVLTLACYELGRRLRERTGGHPVAQPTLVAMAVICPLLLLTDIDYDTYRAAVDPLVFLLGPATVALAVPLYRQAHRLRGRVGAMLVAIPVGAAVSILTAVLLARLAGGEEVVQRTLAPKAATTPVAISLSDQLGGLPPLSAVFAILIGILGAVVGPGLMTRLGIRDAVARGLALGSVSHGIGTSRLLHDDEAQGAFGGLGMGLTALATSLVLPLLALWLF